MFLGAASLDIIIFAFVVLSAIYGLYRGLIKELISLLSWIVAFILAIFISPKLANWLDLSWAGETLGLVFSFSLIFVGVLILSSFMQLAVGRFLNLVGLGSLDRFLGLMFGLARGLIISTILLVLFRELFPASSWPLDSKISNHLLVYEDLVVDLFGFAKNSVETIPDLEPDLNPDL